MTKLGAADAVRLAGAVLFAIAMLDLLLGRETLTVGHSVVGSVGLALLAISAAIDARKAR